MVKIKSYLDVRRPRLDGSCLLKLSICHHRSVRYVSLGLYVKPEFWKSGRVSDSYPNFRRLNNAIDRYRVEAEDVVLEMHSKNEGEVLSVTDYRDAISARLFPDVEKPEAPDRSLIEPCFLRFISLKDRKNTADSYKRTLARLRDFKSDFSLVRFEDVTRAWLVEFEAHLAKTASSQNARALNLRNFRSVFNFAIDEGLTSNYPFRKFKIRTVPTMKRSLSAEDLHDLFSFPVEPYQQKYVDAFKLSFFLMGTNFVDLFALSHENVSKGRLVFNRSKTQHLFSMKLEPEILALLEKYRGEAHLLCHADSCSNYLNFIRRTNKALQSIGDLTRVGRGGKKKITARFPGLTTYWARHSWATVAAFLEIPKETIAAALGHQVGSVVTAIYIDFDNRKVDEANRRVMDWVLYGKK